jgi:hypothetical protein
MQIGLAEAMVLLRKAAAFGDPRLYALSVVAERLAHSTQPLVPERVFVAGANGEPNGSQGMLGMLLNLLVAEKTGFPSAEPGELAGLTDLGDRLTREAVDSLNHSSANGPAAAGAR